MSTCKQSDKYLRRDRALRHGRARVVEAAKNLGIAVSGSGALEGI